MRKEYWIGAATLLAIAVSAAFIMQASRWVNRDEDALVEDANRPIPLKGGRILTGFKYDWKTAEAKLMRLGQALKAHREENALPNPANWKTAEDAGVPPLIRQLTGLRREGMIPKYIKLCDVQDLKVTSLSPKVIIPAKSASSSEFSPELMNDTDFIKLVWPEVLTAKQINAAIAKRGLQTPAFLDTNMYTRAEIREGIKRRVLILRLNGSVETIEVVPTDYLTIMMEK